MIASRRTLLGGLAGLPLLNLAALLLPGVAIAGLRIVRDDGGRIGD